MLLAQFHTEDSGSILITPQQASRFAKEIAGDFNPIHDVDAKRFCVPGDLLFSLVLGKYGLSQRMDFRFAGMVGKGVKLQFPPAPEGKFDICDDAGKTYLHVERDGAVETDQAMIETFIRSYVAFSGQNFPHVLVPLMAAHKVMINTDRPLVIYESMSFNLDQLAFTDLSLEAKQASLEVDGKRGEVLLPFQLTSDGKSVGSGYKKLVLSGLRDYDQAKIDELVAAYAGWKAAYQTA